MVQFPDPPELTRGRSWRRKSAYHAIGAIIPSMTRQRVATVGA
jgi:hypothetical protein